MRINSKDPKIYKFRKYIDKRGYLIPFEYSSQKKGENILPFKIIFEVITLIKNALNC